MARVLHGDAARRWSRLELVEQLGNVGSEVERAIRAHEAGLTGRFEGAFERALELFDLTAADSRWRGHRLQEILRAREEFCRLFFDPGSASGIRGRPPSATSSASPGRRGRCTTAGSRDGSQTVSYAAGVLPVSRRTAAASTLVEVTRSSMPTHSSG